MLKRTRGVALVVTNPVHEILVLQEYENKPHLGKLKGMFSIPMETSHPGEKDHCAINRLYIEELMGLVLPQLPGEYLGVYRIVPGVWVKLYTTKSDSFLLPSVSGDHPEVGNYQWKSPQQALQLWTRQGAREMIEDYAAKRRNVVRRACVPPRNPV